MSSAIEILVNVSCKSGRKTLNRELPKNLDGTYERILCAINEENSIYALRILQWLASSARPLLLEEVAEVVAIDCQDSAIEFDRDEILEDPFDALEICSSLVTVSALAEYNTEHDADYSFDEDEEYYEHDEHDEQSTSYAEDNNQDDDDRNRRDNDDISIRQDPYRYRKHVLSLAHYSVKEYLVSQRISRSPARAYTLQGVDLNAIIADSTISYLLQFQNTDTSCKEIVRNYKLARYSAEYWLTHARQSTKSTTQDKMYDLFSRKDGAFLNWLRVHDRDADCQSPKQADKVAEPFLVLCFIGRADRNRTPLDS